VDEQIARQPLEQHWFITVYIAFYIQGLHTVYNGAGVQACCRAGLAMNQGRRQPPLSAYFTAAYLHSKWTDFESFEVFSLVFFKLLYCTGRSKVIKYIPAFSLRSNYLDQ
jgi:hypothetical protein